MTTVICETGAPKAVDQLLEKQSRKEHSMAIVEQALHLKAANSAALPIYQTLPEQPQRIAVPK